MGPARQLHRRRERRGTAERASGQLERETPSGGIDDASISIERASPLASAPRLDPVRHRVGGRPAGAVSVHSIAVCLLVLGVALWVIYPIKRETAKINPVQPVAQVPVREAPGPGERIVEEFLNAGDWSTRGVSNFELAWVNLTEVERTEAREAGDFKRLVAALGEELDTRQAVYGRAPTESNWRGLSALYTLGQALGVGDSLPVPMLKVKMLEPALSEASTAGGSLGALAAGAPDWKVLDATAGYTLQLFALSREENVRKVLDAYPELDLRVLTVAHGNARHRIVYGLFEVESDAAAAYSRLPLELTRDQPMPIIKSIAESRELAQ